MLRVLFVTPIVLVLAAALCRAQDKLSSGQGYLFAAPSASLGDGPSEGSLHLGGGTANAVNFGGGFNYWFKQRHGLRIEVRDHVRLTGETSHLLGVRIAWAFR